MNKTIQPIATYLWNTLKLGLFLMITTQLTGCILLAAGAGAAGGVYTSKNYDVKVSKKHKDASDKKDSKKDNQNESTPKKAKTN